MVSLHQLGSDETPMRRGRGYGKPVFPTLPECDNFGPEDFVGQGSWSFFKILGVYTQFQFQPVDEWPNVSSYLEVKSIVDSLRVANDVAEQGVKLCVDFAGQAKIEGKLQNNLQVRCVLITFERKKKN